MAYSEERWLPIGTTSLIHFSLNGWENVLFELSGSERVNALLPVKAPQEVRQGKNSLWELAGIRTLKSESSPLATFRTIILQLPYMKYTFPPSSSSSAPLALVSSDVPLQGFIELVMNAKPVYRRREMRFIQEFARGAVENKSSFELRWLLGRENQALLQHNGREVKTRRLQFALVFGSSQEWKTTVM